MRHFGYETEQTANALLNNTELPLDLQALISVELKAENPPTTVAGPSLFYDFTGIFRLLLNLSQKLLVIHYNTTS